MTTERADLAAIKARADAATPGPWHWFGNTDTNQIGLGYWRPGWGRCSVMDFARWGMRDAAPRFHRPDDYIMDRADGLVQYEVAPNATSRKDPKVYRADIANIRHPDAEFIAHAREDVGTLLAEVADLRAMRERVAALLVEAERFADESLSTTFAGGRPVGNVRAPDLRAALVGDDHTGPPE